MKKYFIVVVVIICGIGNSAYSQKILPIEEVVDYYADPEKGLVEDGITYVKDVNNLLESFTGEWQATKGDWSYEVKINTITKEAYGIREDVLTVRYLVTDSSGNIVESTMRDTDQDALIQFAWKYLDDEGNNFFSFGGGKSECGMDGDLIAQTDDEGMVLSLTLVPYGEIYDPFNCPDGKPFYIFPRESLVLNRQ